MRLDTFREDTRALWNACAPHYGTTAAIATVLSIPAILEALRPGPGMRVLDAGCGTGCVAGAADALGADVIGLDFAPEMVRTAQRRFPDIDFQDGDIECLPFADGSFDAVASNFVLSEVSSPVRAMSEIFRVLRPGGRFAFSQWCAPAASPLAGALFGVLDDHADYGLVSDSPNVFHLSDPEAARKMMERRGFDNVHCRTIDNILSIRGQDFFGYLARSGVRVMHIIQSQPPAIRAILRDGINARMAEFAVPGGLEIPMPTLILTGDRP